MARGGSTSATRWVTKLVNRKGKQFRQRYRVALKVAKKLGKRVAKHAKRELKDIKAARARAAKKTAKQKDRRSRRRASQEQKKRPAAKPKTPPAWREILVEGRRKWLRMTAGKGAPAPDKAGALRAMKDRKPTAVPKLGQWQKTGGDNRHRKHKDYAAPHRPKPRRQG